MQRVMRILSLATGSDLADPASLAAQTIHLVMDNLSSHTQKALTDRFGEEEGGALWDRFTVHYTRSEEHTSELQSLRHLVCRLLLEKKKKQQKRSKQHRSTQHKSASTKRTNSS